MYHLSHVGTAGRGLHIAFTGTDGVGKSTQGRILAERLTAAGAPAFLAEAKDDFTNHVVQELLGEDDPYAARRFLGHQITDVVRSFDMLRDIANIVTPRTRAETHVVVPRSVYCRLALARAFGETDPVVISRLEQLLTFHALPDVALWLDVPVDVTMARIRARGTDDEDPDVMARFATALEELHDRHHFVRIDATGTVEEVAATVWVSVGPHLES
ncbi:MAG: dTMP kinase [Egibacteraceae bacterium]